MSTETIGPYVLEQQIGAGGMGNVYLAHPADDPTRQVALKVLPAALQQDEGFVLRFRREIDALRAVHSKHIVEIFEDGLENRQFYYTMEYVDGETLSKRIRRLKRLPWRDAVEIAQQLCVALKAAHDAGVIHRDLKPSNVMVTQDGTVKLTDFGVAQVFASSKLTVTGGVIGTAEYMSPEQALGQRATRRSDLYSLGAVLYAMLTGRPPFSGAATVDVLHKQRYGRFDRPRSIVPDIPYFLDELVVELLAKDPQERPPDAFVLGRRLRELLQRGEPAAIDDEATPPDGSTRVDMTRAPAGEVGATFVRDLVAAQYELSHGRRHWYDSVWVLVPTLLVIVGVIWWSQSPGARSDESRFTQAAEWVHSGSEQERQTARETLAALNEKEASTWSERTEPLLRELSAKSLEDRITARNALRLDPPLNTYERWLRQARDAANNGQFSQAVAQLGAIDALLSAKLEPQTGDDATTEADAAALRQLIASWRAEWSEQSSPGPSASQVLQSAVDNARALATTDPQSARSLLQSVMLIGQLELAAKDTLQVAEELLRSLPAEVPSPAPAEKNAPSPSNEAPE